MGNLTNEQFANQKACRSKRLKNRDPKERFGVIWSILLKGSSLIEME
ncbi:hypothetical protein NLX69_15105 [Rossellomorea sp. BNER]|nr:hypothetical protein [Rossellomorea sp. BNER]